MLHGLEIAPVAELWVAEHVPAVENRAGGHAGVLQDGHDLVLGAVSRPRRDDGIQRVLVAVARDRIGEARVGSQLGRADGGAESLPVGIVAHGDHGPLVVALARVAAVGRHRLVAVAQAPGAAAVEGVVQDALAQEGRAHLVHGEVNPHASARFRPVDQADQHRQLRRPAGQEVGVGVGDLVGHGARRGPARGVHVQVAHERAGAVGRLQRGCHRAEVGPRPGVAVSGVGHHDQVGPHGFQVGIVQAEPAHDPGREVLQHHVGYRNELAQDLQGVVGAQVEGHAELAVIQGLEGAAAFPVELARVVVG